MARSSFVVALTAALFVAATSGLADDWPTFRGPSGNGISKDATLPAAWGSGANVAWKAGVPGEGWSAPVVTGGKVYVTTAVPIETPANEAAQADATATGANDEERKEELPIHRYEIHCFDLASGKLLWKRVAAEGRPRLPKHKDNTFATETPVTDGERIIAYFGGNGLFCYDVAGQLLWQKDLGAFPMQADWGTASSLAMHDGLVFVQVDNEENSFLAALDATFGEERWRIAREEKTNWCSPIIWKNKFRAELVVGGKTIRSYEPATGKLLWQLSVGDRSTSASPAGNEEMLIVGGRGIFAVRAGSKGDITPSEADKEATAKAQAAAADFPRFTSDLEIPFPHSTAGGPPLGGVMWSHDSGGPGMASPLIYDGFVYVCDRRGGLVTCYNAATGEQCYKQRLPEGSEFWASPWAAGGKVFCQDAAGKTFVLAPGAEYKLLGTNLLEGRFWATSATADGSLLLRSADTVYCVRDPSAAAIRAARADTDGTPIRR